MDTKLQAHYRRIRRILIYVLLLNWLVALAKILYGLSSHCASITADGMHSLSDGASNIIGIIGIIFASQPKDKDHPYGHKKYETFFSMGIAALLFIICFNLFKEGIGRIYNPVVPRIDIKSFLVMILTLGINFLVMNYELKKGRLLKSDILVADSMHTKADIFISISVIIALVAIRLGYTIADPIVTIVIALFIAHTSLDILKYSANVLCDTVAIVDVKKIVAIVRGIKGVKACHKIRSRGRSDDIHLDLHVQVSPDMRMDEAHNISYSIEETIKKGIPGITDVVVHMEPVRPYPKP
ncbi:MAG: cation diffusion facilitator family transporter [Candidatus Omnitrophica bacterium]|nr:cation diffusion facilitator family transporter [Candidatus Omnitrophota bacterium]MBU4473477.1 cation diffusion facilitator family transporter [Candidatus Omnitrophota bacterium]MCG2706928.1 cation diffusion facilitator family transporter [Candidatus Omnitrophota bacterium]